MLTLVFGIIAYLLTLSAISTGMVLLLAFFIKPFGLWIIANVSSTEGLYIGIGLLIVVYLLRKISKVVIKKVVHRLIIKKMMTRTMKEYLHDDIEATFRAGELYRKYKNGEVPVSHELKEAIKKREAEKAEALAKSEKLEKDREELFRVGKEIQENFK